jgi:uncharacterized protein YkwD
VRGNARSAVRVARHEEPEEFHAPNRGQARPFGSGYGLANPRLRIRIASRGFSILILGGFLSSATIGCMPSSQTQARGQASSADRTDPFMPQAETPARNRAQIVPRASNEPVGAWRPFGESSSASAEQAPAVGVRHRFGSARNAPNATPRASTLRRRRATSRSGALERQAYELINRDRLNAAQAGGSLRPLRWNEKLAAVARAHSRDMIRRGYFDHVGPDGRSVGDRLRAAGIDWRAAGENIAMARTIPQAEAEFMREPRSQYNHRWNILDSNYTDVGVGIARAPDGQYYITEDFMRSASGR